MFQNNNKFKMKLKNQTETSLPHLGKWLPNKNVFKKNRLSFIYALLIVAIMLIEASLLTYEKEGSSWYSFYIGAFLKYFLRAAIALYFVLVLEKKSLSSLGLRDFKKNDRLFWREIIVTVALCLILLPGVKFVNSQPFYESFSEERLFFHAFYILFVVSLIEEMIWRGFVFSRLSISIGKLLAMFFSSLFMALWHLPYYLNFLPGQGISVFPSLFIAFGMSVVMCIIILLTEKLIGRWNIYPLIILHWLGDIGYYLIRYFAIN